MNERNDELEAAIKGFEEWVIAQSKLAALKAKHPELVKRIEKKLLQTEGDFNEQESASDH